MQPSAFTLNRAKHAGQSIRAARQVSDHDAGHVLGAWEGEAVWGDRGEAQLSEISLRADNNSSAPAGFGGGFEGLARNCEAEPLALDSVTPCSGTGR